MPKVVKTNGRFGWYEFVKSEVNNTAYHIFSLRLDYPFGSPVYTRDELITTVTGRAQGEKIARLLNDARAVGYGIGFGRGRHDS